MLSLGDTPFPVVGLAERLVGCRLRPATRQAAAAIVTAGERRVPSRWTNSCGAGHCYQEPGVRAAACATFGGDDPSVGTDCVGPRRGEPGPICAEPSPHRRGGSVPPAANAARKERTAGRGRLSDAARPGTVASAGAGYDAPTASDGMDAGTFCTIAVRICWSAILRCPHHGFARR